MRRKQLSEPVNAYHATLRRVPDDIILAVGSREIDMGDGNTCVCGWVIREHIARLTAAAPESIDAYANYGTDGNPRRKCTDAFGGTDEEWSRVYLAPSWKIADLEIALAQRIKEASGVA